MQYGHIIKTAYRVTLQYPKLWLLGIFLATGFNAQLVLFRVWRDRGLGAVTSWADMFQSFMQTFERYQYATPLLLAVVFVIGLVITNWAKVLLILELQTILKLRRGSDIAPTDEVRGLGDRRHGSMDLEPGESLDVPLPKVTSVARKSWPQVMQVILVSLFTTAIMIFAGAILTIPFVSFAKEQGLASIIGLAALVLLAFFVFVISCVGVFAAFFVILLKMHYKSAINLATDLMVAKWQEVVSAVILFVVVYGAAFLLGAYVTEALARLVALYSEGVAQMLRTVVLWGWLSVLNVFFYTSMLLLFVRLVKPKMTEEAVAAVAAGSAVQ